jgi:hypothetical protein
MSEISVCPNLKTFEFSGKCCIKTCQFNNNKTKRACLALDLLPNTGSKADGAVTDLFLLNFKILPNQQNFEAKKYNEKFAEYARKKAVTAAKANMTLYLYCSWIKQTLEPSLDFVYQSNSLIDNMLNSFPLNQEELKFEPWMIYYAANPKAYKAFIEQQNRKDDSTPLVNVLGLTPGKHKQVIESIINMTKNKNRRKAKRRK